MWNHAERRKQRGNKIAKRNGRNDLEQSPQAEMVLRPDDRSKDGEQDGEDRDGLLNEWRINGREGSPFEQRSRTRHGGDPSLSAVSRLCDNAHTRQSRLVMIPTKVWYNE
jgi:hypothetical protein